MSVLDDLETAVKRYPRDHLSIRVVHIEYDGQAINVGDDVTFRVEVSNAGPLHVRDLTVKLTGLAGTLVKGNGAVALWADEVVIPIGDVYAHQPQEWQGSERLHLKATAATSAETELARITVEDWDADADHVWNALSGADRRAQASFAAVVEPL